MSQLSKYGSTWPNKWLWQMLSSFRAVDLCTARRHEVTPVLAKTQMLKFYQSHMGKQRPFKGIIEPRLGIIETHWGIIEPLLAITKPAEGINKPYLGDIVISSAASEAKTSIIARTSAKAVDSLYAQICLRTSNHPDSYYLKIIFSEPSLVKFPYSPIPLQNKSVFPMEMYCFCHCFLYSRTECIM